MRAVPALFINGRVSFTFGLPAEDGPVSVLVIFPSESWEEEELDLDHPGAMDLSVKGPDDRVRCRIPGLKRHKEALI